MIQSDPSSLSLRFHLIRFIPAKDKSTSGITTLCTNRRSYAKLLARPPFYVPGIVKSLPDLSSKPAFNDVLKELRTEILRGKWKPGTRLPSTRELVATSRTSYRLVHTALKALVREGWIERRHGSGTYVVDAQKRFVRAGIYHASDFLSDRQSVFGRNLHSALVGRLAHLEKEIQIFVDTRPDAEQVTLLPSLAEAIHARHIQCVLVSSFNAQDAFALSKIKIPMAFLGEAPSPNFVSLDTRHFIRTGIRLLAAQGCRSIGFVSNCTDTRMPDFVAYYAVSQFEQAIRETGLHTQPQWISSPPPRVSDIEKLGHSEFRRLWALPEKPEGLLVLPDLAVRGVISAALELGVKVPREIKFLFQRNKQIPIWSPFPAIWGTSDEDALARNLIEMIQRQFAQETITPIFIPYEFTNETGA